MFVCVSTGWTHIHAVCQFRNNSGETIETEIFMLFQAELKVHGVLLYDVDTGVLLLSLYWNYVVTKISQN